MDVIVDLSPGAVLYAVIVTVDGGTTGPIGLELHVALAVSVIVEYCTAVAVEFW